MIREHYNASQSFEPSLLVIATWDSVGHYKSASEWTNTFQTLLVTDGLQSFVIFQYADLQWMQSEPKYPESTEQR